MSTAMRSLLLRSPPSILRAVSIFSPKLREMMKREMERKMKLKGLLDKAREIADRINNEHLWSKLETMPESTKLEVKEELKEIIGSVDDIEESFLRAVKSDLETKDDPMRLPDEEIPEMIRETEREFKKFRARYFNWEITKSNQNIARAALDDIKMGDKTLTVRRANQGAVQPRPDQESILLHDQEQKLVLQAGSLPTKVVCLTEVVNGDELKDDEKYEDIMEDMRGEGEKYGKLVSIVIPRPSPNRKQCPGVGKVFLEYADVDGSTKARMGLNGTKFGGNQVLADFYQEAKFAQGEYDG